jgi:hypothetical protein
VDEENEFGYEDRKQGTEEWQTLVHVCRRWRTVVFGSTIRLKLRLACTNKTPARDTLDVWPALPLLIEDEHFLSEGVDNIVAALECSDRVDEINLWEVDGSPMEKILAAMQVPFPNLTYLTLYSKGEVTVLPDPFLDEYAPNLEFLALSRIPIPRLPSLLLHSTKLSRLYLHGIPHSGYFSPEEFVTCLPSLRNLLEFILTFESPLSCRDRESRHPPPLTRTVLPELRELKFRGVSEYLEDLLVRIDAPRLSTLDTTLFNQIDFYTPQLVRFINRTPKLNVLEIAKLCFGDNTARVSLSSLAEHQANHHPAVNVKISCQELDWQVSSLEQLCTLFLPSTSAPEGLYIYPWNDSGRPYRKDTGNVENALWLALLHPFTAAKNLYLSKEFTPSIAPALQELAGGRTTELLPTLHNIFLEEVEPSGPVQEAIGMIVAARQLSGHPVAVSHWEGDPWLLEQLRLRRRDL